MTNEEKIPCEDMEQKKLDIKAFLHVKKGQPLPDCPFRLKVTGKTNVDVIIASKSSCESTTKFPA